jgi:hypothetical protein
MGVRGHLLKNPKTSNLGEAKNYGSINHCTYG